MPSVGDSDEKLIAHTKTGCDDANGAISVGSGSFKLLWFQICIWVMFTARIWELLFQKVPAKTITHS